MEQCGATRRDTICSPTQPTMAGATHRVNLLVKSSHLGSAGTKTLSYYIIYTSHLHECNIQHEATRHDTTRSVHQVVQLGQARPVGLLVNVFLH